VVRISVMDWVLRAKRSNLPSIFGNSLREPCSLVLWYHSMVETDCVGHASLAKSVFKKNRYYSIFPISCISDIKIAGCCQPAGNQNMVVYVGWLVN